MAGAHLPREANNHFGIKCHNDWVGAKVYHHDDRRNECFRKYSKAEDSFYDHSEFLKTGSRYGFLFGLSPTDYKGWAHGLKKAGYATNPDYANMLIRTIEEENLHYYDDGYNPAASTAPGRVPAEGSPVESNTQKKKEPAGQKALEPAVPVIHCIEDICHAFSHITDDRCIPDHHEFDSRRYATFVGRTTQR